jgi:hypothetical protein
VEFFLRINMKKSQTIPMSEVVTEPVPKSGRMNWYLGGNKKKGGYIAHGGDGPA